MRVLVVDDHSFGRSTLAGALAGRGLDVRAAGTARDAHAVAFEFRPAVAVVDLDLGAGPTGIDLARALRKLLPEIGIVILTSYRDPRLAGGGLPELPSGSVYVCKADVSDVGQLMRSIELVARAPLAQRTLSAMTTGPTAELTDVQVEVLLAVGAGITTAEIAQQRGVSASAVEQTIARICERLEIPRHSSLNQRVQLVQALNRLRGQVAGG
ncbi:MAG: DNA-binding response regulator [Gaiellales bacterium]